MKTRIVLASLMATMMVLEVSAQRAEYDDMYFRGKDREKHKAAEAEETYTPVKKQKQAAQESDADYYANPTDSYSGRNLNPEYVSRSNSEQASDEEANYYSEDYESNQSSANYNNSYYNNANWANNSYYGNSMWNNSFYGGMGYGMGYGMGGFNNPWMSPYYGGGFYDPWMNGYGFGPNYGWRSGWSVSFMYGNGWGYGNPYYGGGYGWGYPNYYYGGGGYYGGYESVRGNYGKRPTRSSAGLSTNSTRPSRTVAGNPNNNTNVSNGRATRVRQSQDEYYVRPSRRATTTSPSPSLFDSPSSRPSRSTNFGGNNNNSQPTRTRESYSPPSRSSSPSSSPSRGSSGGSGGGGARPRGRG